MIRAQVILLNSSVHAVLNIPSVYYIYMHHLFHLEGHETINQA